MAHEPWSDDALEAWSATAVNLPEHGRNRIHTDEGAREAGFPAALVAGVSVYAYLTHVPVAAWGIDWLRRGGGEVRFGSPVFAGEVLDCRPTGGADDVAVLIGAVGGEPRATLDLVHRTEPPGPHREGEPLSVFERLLTDADVGHGERLGDDHPLYRSQGLVHPATWPSLANDVVHTQLVRGSWIHTRSRIAHHDVARAGETATVHATVVRRFESRIGERAVLDVTIRADGRVVATLEHEAIISVRR